MKRASNKNNREVDSTKYLRLQLNRLTWKTHIWNKRKQLGFKIRKIVLSYSLACLNY